MSAIRKAKTGVPKQQLMAERELRSIVDTVFRLAKSIGVAETEVHVDETISALTRFANNGIHQNVAERTLNVSVRTQVEQRTARATTNRTDGDSLRAAIEASLSLAHSQPKNPNLLAMPAKHRYRAVNRFIKQTAMLTPEDRARAVRRARPEKAQWDLASLGPIGRIGLARTRQPLSHSQSSAKWQSSGLHL